MIHQKNENTTKLFYPKRSLSSLTPEEESTADSERSICSISHKKPGSNPKTEALLKQLSGTKETCFYSLSPLSYEYL